MEAKKKQSAQTDGTFSFGLRIDEEDDPVVYYWKSSSKTQAIEKVLALYAVDFDLIGPFSGDLTGAERKLQLAVLYEAIDPAQLEDADAVEQKLYAALERFQPESFTHHVVQYLTSDFAG
jgi:hypothetical protein